MATNPLQDICDQFATAIKSIQGLRMASSLPPSQMSAFPYADIYVASASWTPAPSGMMTGMLIVNIDLHLAMKDQEREIPVMNRLQNSIVNALWLALKGGTLPALQTINKVDVQLSVFSNGAGAGVDTVGYQFKAEVKYQGVIQ